MGHSLKIHGQAHRPGIWSHCAAETHGSDIYPSGFGHGRVTPLPKSGVNFQGTSRSCSCSTPTPISYWDGAFPPIHSAPSSADACTTPERNPCRRSDCNEDVGSHPGGRKHTTAIAGFSWAALGWHLPLGKAASSQQCFFPPFDARCFWKTPSSPISRNFIPF